MYYIYIIRSKKTGKLYIGHTDNVARRLWEHNNNPRMTFTHKFRPWKLLKSFPVSNNRSDAMKIEKYIKKMKSKKFVIKLIDDPDLFNEIAQRVRVPKHRD